MREPKPREACRNLQSLKIRLSPGETQVSPKGHGNFVSGSARKSLIFVRFPLPIVKVKHTFQEEVILAENAVIHGSKSSAPWSGNCSEQVEAGNGADLSRIFRVQDQRDGEGLWGSTLQASAPRLEVLLLLTFFLLKRKKLNQKRKLKSADGKKKKIK